MARRQPGNDTALACFLLSGAAGLLYEMVWVRKASLIFGSTSMAISTVLAVFFGGLALGNYLSGRLSSRVRRPLRAYAVLEIGIGLLALTTLPLLSRAGFVFSKLYPSYGAEGAGLLAAFFLTSVVILPPCVLLGATFPQFCRFYIGDRSAPLGPLAGAYAANTLGGVAAVLAAGFWLFPHIGVARTLVLGSAISLGVGIVLLLGFREDDVPATARGERAPARGRHRLGLLAFLVGFTALGYQIVWSRLLTLLVRNTVYSYTIMLAIVLVGIVLGSLSAPALKRRGLSDGVLFALLQTLTGIVVIGLLRLPAGFWRGVDNKLVIYALLLLPAAVLSGACFPLIVGMAVQRWRQTGRSVGSVTALNTIGGICGSLVVGFGLLPLAGLERSAVITTAISLGTGVAAVWWFAPAVATYARWGLTALPALAWILLVTVPSTRLPADLVADRDRLVEFREGRESTLAVVLNERGNLSLEIDRNWQGSNKKSHQIMAAHVPMLLHPKAEKVLVVGVGAGLTPSRFLLHPVQRLDCVDIEPEVFDLIRTHFDSEWMNDPRVRLVPGDGRVLLAHASERYDIVSLELGQVFKPGVASFYTRELYEDVAASLNADGLAVQFVPLPYLSPSMFASVLKTFQSVFPQSVLWYNTSEMLMAGKVDAPVELDLRTIQNISALPAVDRDLAYSHWGGSARWLNLPYAFVAGFFCGPAQVRALASGGQILRDDVPVLEYETAAYRPDDPKELAIAAMIEGHLAPFSDLLSGDPPERLLSDAREMRWKNLHDLRSQALLRAAGTVNLTLRPRTALNLIRKALEANPESLYALEARGSALIATRRPDEALTSFEQAVGLDPQNARLLYLLAVCLEALNRTAEAIEAYERVVGVDARHADALYNLGTLLVREGRTLEAIDRLSAALELEPGRARVHNNLGVAYTDIGDRVSALRHFEDGLRADPFSRTCLARAAWIRATYPEPPVRDPARAVALARRLNDLQDRPTTRTLDTLAAALAAQGDFESAVQAAERALRTASSDESEALRHRLALYRQGKAYLEPPPESKGASEPKRSQ